MDNLEFRSPLGRPLKYTPKQLVEKFQEYLTWCEDHPLLESDRAEGSEKGKAFWNTTEKNHPRYVSIGGFLVFIGGNETWWSMLDKGKRGEEFLKVKQGVSEYCRQYQLEMASAGFLKQNIISRLLGLVDKKDVQTSGNGVTIIVKNEEEKDKIENIGNLGI